MSNSTEIGNAVCIFLGISTPFVIRSIEDKTLLVGDAYIQGIMNGEVLNGVKSEEFPWEPIELHWVLRVCFMECFVSVTPLRSIQAKLLLICEQNNHTKNIQHNSQSL